MQSQSASHCTEMLQNPSEPFDCGMHAIFLKGKYIAEDKVITRVCEVIIVCIHISEFCLAKTDVEHDYRSGKVSLSIV